MLRVLAMLLFQCIRNRNYLSRIKGHLLKSLLSYTMKRMLGIHPFYNLPPRHMNILSGLHNERVHCIPHSSAINVGCTRRISSSVIILKPYGNASCNLHQPIPSKNKPLYTTLWPISSSAIKRAKKRKTGVLLCKQRINKLFLRNRNEFHPSSLYLCEACQSYNAKLVRLEAYEKKVSNERESLEIEIEEKKQFDQVNR